MEQLIQNYRTGELSRTVVPVPQAIRGRVLVRTRASAVSIGTERAMLELAQKTLLGKSLARRDLTRQVIQKARSEGVSEAWRQAMGRLDTPQPLGYSSAGVVFEVGPGVTSFNVGDRVACTGSGFAGHAQIASIPANLCVPIPDEVEEESASFVALGGIALEAMRVARVSLGESVLVIGLGLIGLLTVQLLKAAGCDVLCVEPDVVRTDLAKRFGAKAVSSYGELSQLVASRTSGHGVDAVIITAATSSNEPLEQAAVHARERARIVATGLVGLEVPRQAFYDKELELVVSRAWGPGLYDPNYVDRGLDYPISYARWTAERNMGEFLRQIADGAVDVSSLITHRFPFEQATEAYELIVKGNDRPVGVVITYPVEELVGPASRVRVDVSNASQRVATGLLRVGVIGAGLYAKGTLLPALKKVSGVELRGIVSASGLSARHAADKFGFGYCASHADEIVEDDEIDAVFVLTRHGAHAELAVRALQAGKHVFVEKPLAVTEGQLSDVARAALQASGLLFVGFNRRYSEPARWLKARFTHCRDPLAVHCTVNAGAVNPSSWVHDPVEGGGRVIGEVCHFVDLVQYLTGSDPLSVHATGLGVSDSSLEDSLVASLELRNGGIASILYVSRGSKRFPRERIEIFGGGAVGVIDDFRSASYTDGRRSQRTSRRRGVDRGLVAELEVFIRAVNGDVQQRPQLIEDITTTATTFSISQALRSGRREHVDPDRFLGKSTIDETAAFPAGGDM